MFTRQQLSIFAAALAGAAGGIFVAGYLPRAAASSDVVEARELRIVDDSGRVCAAVRADQGRGEAILFSDDGSPRLRLKAHDDGAEVSLAGPRETHQMTLQTSSAGSLVAIERAGKPRFAVNAGDNDTQATLFGADTQPAANLLSNRAGASLFLYNPDKSASAGLLSEELRTGMVMLDSNGRPRFDLLKTGDNLGMLFRDPAGRLRLGLGMPQGAPGIVILDEQGETTWDTPEAD